MKATTICKLLSVLVVVIFANGSAFGEEKSELARKAQNPIGDLISLPFQNNTNFGVGPDDDVQNILNIQPVWPFAMGEDWTVITRTIIPLVWQPGVVAGEDNVFGLGDSTFTAFFSPKTEGLIWGVGPVTLIPTATNDRLGSDKWGLGPSIVMLAKPGNWVVGTLISNVWSVAGSGDEEVNFFTWQYFINYNMADGWYLTSTPTMTADWTAESGQQWTVPVGGGAGKVFTVGKQPMNAKVQGFYNVTKPDGGADWTLQIQLQFLFPK